MTLNILMIGALAILIIMLIEKHLENKMLVQELMKINNIVKDFDKKLNEAIK